MSHNSHGLDVRGVIFDLDGTLVDSRLDFDAMRYEMGLPAGRPILETLAELDPPAAKWRLAILARHEHEGAARAVAMPGAGEFLVELGRLGIKRAVLTRNSRASTGATLDRLRLEIDLVVARDDGPVKPDPAGIWKICEAWGLPREQVVLIGDYRFDLEAAKSAGVRSVLYTVGHDAAGIEYARLADFILPSFDEGPALLSLDRELRPPK